MVFVLLLCFETKCVEFVDEKFHQLVSSDGSKANATIITTSVDNIGDGNFNLSSLDDGEGEAERKQWHLKWNLKVCELLIQSNTLVNVRSNGNY